MMRVLVHDYAGHPFQVQLSRGLAARGIQVLHAYSASVQTPRGELARQPGDPTDFDIRGIALSMEIRKYNFFERFRLESEYAARLVELCAEFKPDVVLSANTPSIVQNRLMRFCKERSIRLVTWVQDLYGLAAYRILKKKLPVLGHLVGQYFMYLDRQSLRGSAAVVVITEDFVPLIESWGVSPERLHTIHNWAPLEDLPERPRDNAWARTAGLDERLRFLYSGTLSIRHNPALLAGLAEALAADSTDNRRASAGEEVADEKADEVLVVSRGTGIDWLREQAAERQWKNVRFFDFQPFEVMADVFGSADVLLAILEPDAGVFCVPSKVLSYMCAGRPLLLAMPRENLAARIVEQYQTGLVVDPTDQAGFIAAARRLASDSDLRIQLGKNARRFAEEKFNFGRICDTFEAVLIGQKDLVPAN